MPLNNALYSAQRGRIAQETGKDATLANALNYAKGAGAQFAGLPGDISDLAKILYQAKQGYVAPQEASKYSTEGIGNMLGADTDSGAFMAGSMGFPDLTDVLKVAGPAAIMGGIHGLNKLTGLKQVDNGGELAGALMAAGAPGADVSMTAWHGSPHKFDKLSIDSAGNDVNRGGSSFGRGINIASDPAHAKVYGENFYEVDFPDSEAAKTIDWHKPLSEQPEYVQKVLDGIELPKLESGQKFGNGSIVQTEDGWRLKVGDSSFRLSDKEINRMFGNEKTGEQVYRRLEAKLGSDKAASDYLNSIGIKGTRFTEAGYPDNFVVFDENSVKALKRNNEPLK